tara:strand:- start:654 stop:1610 length:957 start_codon:yes stop_codon:yes gene_type:complete
MGPLDQVLPAHPVLSQQLKLASDDWYVGKSEVAGQGVFAGKDYELGDRIGLAMTDGGEDEFSAKIWNVTELARYCNHQNRNNVDIEKDGDRFHLVAIEPIGQDEELVSNYWQVARAKGPHSVMLYEGKQVPTSDLSDYVEKEAASRVRVAMPYGKGYLMEKMNNPKYPDNLGKVRFPGGGIDEGETAEEAAVREMQEELGLTVDPAMLKRLGIYADGTYGPEQYLSYDKHGLEPGDYEATVGGDKQIELLESGTDNPNFWGSKLDELQKEAKDKKEFVHSCCGEPSGKCAGCSEGSVLMLKDEYEKTGNRPSRNKADS